MYKHHHIDKVTRATVPRDKRKFLQNFGISELDSYFVQNVKDNSQMEQNCS